MNTFHILSTYFLFYLLWLHLPANASVPSCATLVSASENVPVFVIVSGSVPVSVSMPMSVSFGECRLHSVLAKVRGSDSPGMFCCSL